MKTFVLSFLGGLAALVFFFMLVPLAIILTVLPSNEPEPVKSAVISLDLRGTWPDQPASDGINALFSDISFVEVLLRLNAASRDPNVKGVFIRAPEASLGSSRAEELRSALLRLKENDKFVIAHSQGFLASGPGAYRAISAADEIWIQPGAQFEVPGISFETLFMGDAFKTLKVTAEIEQFREYKNAPDVYKQTGYTPAHAEAMQTIADTVWKQSLQDIASDRGFEFDALRTTLEDSPYTAQQSVDLRLTDRLGWPEDALRAAIVRGAFTDVSEDQISIDEVREARKHLIDIASYTPDRSGRSKDAAVIAIVGGEGGIIKGGGGTSNVLNVGTPVFASDTVSSRLRDLAHDDSVDAVVFRVDSGGGDATASDQIWQSVEYLKAAGKTVVVSMGSAAASGGYYVAAGADAIVANPSTLTGSIGVYGGKFAVADGLRQFGINPDTIVAGGEYATVYSAETLTDTQRSKLIGSLEATYDRFTTLVSEGRGIPLERVQEIARGRVWTGADALGIGLVDETGDLIDAITKAKVMAGFDADADVRIRLRRPQASPLNMLRGLVVAAQVSAEHPSLIQTLASVLGDERASAGLQQLEMLSRRGAQLAAPIVIER